MNLMPTEAARLLTSPPLLRAKRVVYCKLNFPSIFWVIAYGLLFAHIAAE